MNQSLTLPMADKFYHDKQTSAFIRSVNVSWEKPEKRRKIREKRLETLCRPVYNRNTMGVLFEDERREAAL